MPRAETAIPSAPRRIPVYPGPMTLITDSATLAGFCKRQAKVDYLAVDTEFMRDKTYWPQLCLVQVAGPEEAVAIDTLANGIDLAPLFDLLTSPKLLKVFHAARQDIEVLFQDRKSTRLNSSHLG